ncbi:MAG: HD domain-containing protein [Chloroflexi bacterium]|nr:HD domain-containing protein [Chloroflexota bacterium]
MVSESSTPRRPVLTLDELAQPVTRRPDRIHALTAAEMAIAFSKGLDLAEGKEVGHAQRVCYIATQVADVLNLAEPARSGVYFGALLHDAGVTASSADLFRAAGVDETTVFGPSPLRGRDDQRGTTLFADRTAIDDAVHGHCSAGAGIVRQLELGDDAARAVESHHEHWDGSGYPEGLAEEEIPIEARIVALADVAEVLISDELNALVARRRLPQSLEDYSGRMLDPRLVGLLLDLAKSDEFWLGLYSEDLAETVNSLRGAVETRKSRKRATRFAEVFADLADAKRSYGSAHSRRTAECAQQLAEAVELEPAHVEMIRIAALLLDVGLLGVPARIMTKPDILSVTEMQLMRQHPANSEMILEDLPGFEEVSQWIARHHERPDGKGYPEMLSGDDIALESRILAIADVYAALTADRPHRAALSRKDARQVLFGAAGTQLDPELVRSFVSLL